MGGATAFLLILNLRLGADFPSFIIVTLLLSGLVGSARLSLDEHSPSQIYIGYLLGFVTMERVPSTRYIL